MRNLSEAILLGGFLLLAPHAAAQRNDESWNNLRKLTKAHTYNYTDRAGDCGKGQIAKVTDQAITFKRLDHTKVTIQRADLLRVGQWSFWPIGTLYSARSSWYDVKLLPHDAKNSDRRARIQIVTNDGKEHDGELLEADDSSLKLRKRGREFSYAKGDISRLYVMEFRPISDQAEYAAQELFVFVVLDPEVWISLIRIPVLLYSAAKPEENVPIVCRQAGSNSTTRTQIF